MKKIIIAITSILILIGMYYYLIVLGGPIKKTLNVNGCNQTYTHFITDNRYQVKKTHGHASDNNIELGGAKIEVAKCLCASYLNKHSPSDSIEIFKILTSAEYFKSKTLFDNILEDYSIDTITIEKVCKNQEKYLQKMTID